MLCLTVSTVGDRFMASSSNEIRELLGKTRALLLVAARELKAGCEATIVARAKGEAWLSMTGCPPLDISDVDGEGVEQLACIVADMALLILETQDRITHT
jgi:hypothetical protein